MVLGLGGLIVLLIIILVVSLQQLSLQLPVYEELLLQRLDAFTAALGNVGIDVQGALDSFVVDTTALAKSAIDAVLGLLSNSVAIVAQWLSRRWRRSQQAVFVEGDRRDRRSYRRSLLKDSNRRRMSAAKSSRPVVDARSSAACAVLMARSSRLAEKYATASVSRTSASWCFVTCAACSASRR